MKNKPKKVTRNDIARLAGVAPSTVSNVLNNKRVSDKLRNRVLQAIEELDYTPNLVARSLVTKSSKHIELIITDITNPNFAAIAEGMQMEAHRFGYMLSISLSNENEMDQLVDSCVGRNVDAVVFLFCYDAFHDRLKRRLLNHDIIVVDIHNRYVFPQVAPHIRVEPGYMEGMKKAFKHLVDLGHKRIAYVTAEGGEMEKGFFRESRAEIFRQCSIQYFGQFDEKYMITNSGIKDNHMIGLHAGKELMHRNLDCTAAIVVSDSLVFGFLKALRDAGKSVPNDLSVVSFGNTPFAQTSNPTLTSVTIPTHEIGETIVRYIMGYKERMEEMKETIQMDFPVDVVSRESTGMPRY